MMKRREFLSASCALAAGMLCDNRTFAQSDTAIRIDSPFHGAVLHRRLKDPVVAVLDSPDGKPEGLRILVRGEAPEGIVQVNGRTARRQGRRFELELDLREKATEIIASTPSGPSASARVWWLKNSFPRYRFTVDDTIYCLREIHRKGYKSLFDDYFLGHIRKLNRKYGTKFALNLFYETSDDRAPFDLSRFSDRYRSEWRDNADWLRLLFHAKREHPGEPYKNASAEELIRDCKQLESEVARFAGEETLLPPTVIHFGEVRPETYVPLAKHGVTTLSGYFVKNAAGRYYVHYQMDEPRCDYLNKHDFLLDCDSGIVFSKMDMVLNLMPLEKVVPGLEKSLSDRNTAEFIDLMTHEQYFWPFYHNYIPDHWERLDRAFAFLTDRGYKPVFLNDPLLGLDDV